MGTIIEFELTLPGPRCERSQDPPARCAARPPPRHRGPWRPRPSPPPRAALRGWMPGAAPAAGGGAPGASGKAAGSRGAPAELGQRTHAAGRAARAFPSPAARSASRRDVRGRPPAQRSSGQSACGRRAHGPAGRADSGRRGPGEGRGAASEDEPRHAPAPDPLEWISTRKGCWRSR
uniref:Uncharacterized protein n=1 Tax=Rangifer tarandus platyrhynchus TaxID=3082113 RepID=A0ACB0DWU7_RANTA|nr:unnamed protein product [Rangifer tarandus platyrhynchus]